MGIDKSIPLYNSQQTRTTRRNRITFIASCLGTIGITGIAMFYLLPPTVYTDTFPEILQNVSQHWGNISYSLC